MKQNTLTGNFTIEIHAHYTVYDTIGNNNQTFSLQAAKTELKHNIHTLITII